ncbi:MAG: hypothetical protein LQ339_007127 [Xanthoria mediterranea]|nr:MAG: hypothetical protein LQ339_007127 [Xanthoria mediterranea]
MQRDSNTWDGLPHLGGSSLYRYYSSSSYRHLLPEIPSPSIDLDLPPFKFLDLPIELRHLIYRLIFIGHTTIHRFHRIETCNRVPTSFRQPTKPNHPLLNYKYFNLLQTCRQINREASEVLYSQNTFVLRMAPPSMGGFPLSYRFLQSIGPDNCRLLRHVKLCIHGEYSPVTLKDPTGYWQDTLATLWARCRLKSLIVELYLHYSQSDGYQHNSYHLEFRYDIDGDHGQPPSILAGKDCSPDWRSLEQVKLELNASVRAFETCHGLE